MFGFSQTKNSTVKCKKYKIKRRKEIR